MATAKFTAPVPTGMSQTMTKLDVVDNAVNDPTRNVRGGPTTLKGFVIDNTKVTTNAAMWAKFYNVVDDTFVAGTALPSIIIPIAALAADPITEGLTVGFISEGVSFAEGLSVLASKEAGDTMTDAPATDVDIFLMTDS